jgi:hypothetical protein
MITITVPDTEAMRAELLDSAECSQENVAYWAEEPQDAESRARGEACRALARAIHEALDGYDIHTAITCGIEPVPEE